MGRLCGKGMGGNEKDPGGCLSLIRALAGCGVGNFKVSRKKGGVKWRGAGLW